MSEIILGDCLEVLKTLPSEMVDCCVTSPPYYGLRDYGHDGQIGLEDSPVQYVDKLVSVFQEVKRVLKPEGTLWLNLGDSYAGSGKGIGCSHGKAVFTDSDIGQKMNIPDNCKPKDLIGIPWMVAFALRTDGWYLRQDIIWHKPNPMPESVTDRCTKSHEYIFLLSKNAKYYYDHEAIKEPSLDPDDDRGARRNVKRFPTEQINGIRNSGIYPMANKRDVWTVATKPYSEAHFATYPPDLIGPMILAGCPKDGTVLDPFFGAGTTGLVSKNLGRNFIGIELNPDYIEMDRKRIYGELFCAVNL